MLSAPLPDNEEERLKKLYELNILDTFEEQAYDDLTHLAAQICDVPIALISLIDRDRQFLKSHYGLNVNEISREFGFCPHAILDNDLTIVEDAKKDERFHDNPLVTDGPRVNFYAGAPLIFSGDIRIGTLCVVDYKARTITPDQQLALQALARQVVSQLELRQSVEELKNFNKYRTAYLTKMEHSETRERSRGSILEKLAKGSSLGDVLDAIALSIENEIEGALCSILTLDDEGKHLLIGAAPSLPKFYNDAIHGLEIGYGIGSCGTAAHSGQRIIVEDVQVHPFWESFKELTSKAGLVSCWSEPIINKENNVLGTFAIYFATPCVPDKAGLSTIEYAAHLTGIAIQHKQKEESLIKAERMAVSANMAKSEFLSNMSHELRTPLNAIMGFGQLLEMAAEHEVDKEAKNNASEIVKAGSHLLELINEILDLSKIEAGKLKLHIKDCSLNDLLHECIKLIKPLAARQAIHIIDDITFAADHTINVDHTRMKQVLLNLLSNSIKFNKPEGTVTLACEAIGTEYLRIKVTDTGKGLTKQQQKKLFSPFERVDTDKNIEGTGIGLVISKRMVELMGGAVGFDSQPGHGSTFWVQVVLSQTNKQRSSIAEPDAINVASNSVEPSPQKTILYIEDNPANLDMVKQVIEKFTSYGFISAPNAHLGFVLAEAKIPDLILMDINLPGMDGYEARNQLQMNPATCNIPMIAVSANAMSSDIKKGMQAGFKNYLTKPVNMKMLLSMVTQLLD